MVEHPLRRRDGWPRLLHEYLASKARTQFRYGSHDCGLFTAGAVYAITGVDIAAGARAAGYEKKADLERIYGENWIRRLDEIFAQAMLDAGLPGIDIKRAQRGDVVMYRGDVFCALGVCLGANSLFAAPHGLVAIETLKCERAWHV